MFCPAQVFPADKKRPENNTCLFEVISRMVKYFVVLFRNNFRQFPTEALLFKKAQVLLEAVTLAWRTVQAMIGYDEDLFQARILGK